MSVKLQLWEATATLKKMESCSNVISVHTLKMIIRHFYTLCSKPSVPNIIGYIINRFCCSSHFGMKTFLLGFYLFPQHYFNILTPTTLWLTCLCLHLWVVMFCVLQVRCQEMTVRWCGVSAHTVSTCTVSWSGSTPSRSSSSVPCVDRSGSSKNESRCVCVWLFLSFCFCISCI